MFAILLSLFTSISLASEIDCRKLMSPVDYKTYQQLRSDHSPAASNSNVITSYGKRSWTFWVGASAKLYLAPETSSVFMRQPKSKLIWIHQESYSPLVYLFISVGSDDRARSQLVKFDLRTRESKLLLESFYPLYSESLIIRRDVNLAILKATYTPNSGNRFETTTYMDSWIIRLSDGQTKTLPHSRERIGLSHAGRAQLRHLHVPAFSGDIQSVTVDGQTYYRGAVEWIRGGEFLIVITSKNLHVWKLDAIDLNIVEVPPSTLGEDVTFTRAD